MTAATAAPADRGLTLAWCQEYLSARLPDALDDVVEVKVAEVTKFPRGVSRETWMVETVVTTADGRQASCPLTIRRDQAIGSIDDSPLSFEYGIYRRLAGTDVPVARPLWYSDDPADDPDGRLHYVREQVIGDWQIPGYKEPDPEYDDFRIEVSKEYLRTMAVLHNLDWQAAGFGDLLEAPSSLERCAVDTLDREVARIDRPMWEAHPVLAESYHALSASAPTDAPCISLCKGTSGLGEEIWRDGRIVALSDWESCSLGDPANDFARSQEMIPTVVGPDGEVRWDTDKAMDYYTEISGIPVSPERVAWYHLLYGFAIVRFSQSSMQGLRTGHHLVRLAWTATDVLMQAQVRVARGSSVSPLPVVERG